MKKNVAITGLLVFLGWQTPLLATDYTMVNGLIGELGQVSESVTYGNFKAGTYRNAFNAPINYGTLIDITPTPGNGAILWFQDEKGVIRNADIADASKPIIIYRRGAVTDVQ